MNFPAKFYDAIYAMSEDKIKECISNLQEGVLLVCPNAKLMFRTNAKKKIISVGIYDSKIILSHLGHVANEQDAPQLLGATREFRDSYNQNSKASFNIYLEVWMEAYTHLLLLRKIPDYTPLKLAIDKEIRDSN
jgi:hypothetical protein